MPKTDYKKTVIYKIQNNELDELLYVGHTTHFRNRKVCHKRNCNNPNDKEKHNLKLYQTIRDNGGWDAFSMVVIKEFPCENKRQAEAEEDRVMREMKSSLNMKRAFETPEERYERRLKYGIKWRKDNQECLKEKTKIYYQENKEHIKDYQKKRYTDKIDEIKEYQKKYAELYKDKISNYQKQYQQENKEHFKEYKREHYLKNKDKLNEKNECPCGGRYSFSTKARHFKTIKHQNFLKNNP
jgi:hypothetical protein